MRQTYRASDPIRAPIPAKTTIPIEVTRAPIHGCRDVTQPQRTKRVVVQKVYAENSKVVFRAQHSNVNVIELENRRVGVQIIEGVIVQMVKATMQIDVICAIYFAGRDRRRYCIRCE